MKTKLLLFLCILSFAPLMGQSLDGAWEGNLNVMGTKLAIVIHIDTNKHLYSTDSPDQGAYDLPMEELYLSKDSIALKSSQLSAIFTAKLKNDQLQGTFSQRGFKIPIQLDKQKNGKKLDREQQKLLEKIQGTWSGALNVQGNSLTIRFNFSQNPLKITMDSPDQQAYDIPANLISISADSVEIEVKSIGVKYKATIKDDCMEGTFFQMNISLPLKMQRLSDIQTKEIKEIKRPQTPQPPFSYKTQEVTFTNPQGNSTLAGTITYPIGYDKKRKAKTPIIVFVSGSGQQDRDETIFDHKPFAVIADYFAHHGIASLRYDDRGIGGSKGEVANATTKDFMQDAVSAVQYLRQEGFKKIGIVGHSEGGMIALMAAAQGKTDFIICLAAPGVRGDQILYKQITFDEMSDCNQNKAFRKVVKEIMDYLSKGGSYKDADDLMAQTGNPKMEGLNDFQKRVVQQVTQMMKNPWMRYFVQYDPTKDIQNVSCPIMALNGDKDHQVFADDNIENIRHNLPQGKHNMIKRYPNLNHLFQHCNTGYPNEYANIEETISEEVLQDMAKWIHEVTK